MNLRKKKKHSRAWKENKHDKRFKENNEYSHDCSIRWSYCKCDWNILFPLICQFSFYACFIDASGVDYEIVFRTFSPTSVVLKRSKELLCDCWFGVVSYLKDGANCEALLRNWLYRETEMIPNR